jgi:hypothetical protein
MTVLSKLAVVPSDAVLRADDGEAGPERRGDTATAPISGVGDHLLSGGALGLALVYATVRYNVFKGVAWADWPSYTVNKALAVGALVLIAIAVLRLVRGGRTAALLAWSGALAWSHSLLSFALLNPSYFPRFFDGVKLGFNGGASLAVGAGIMAMLELGARRAGGWSVGIRIAALAVLAFAAGIHAALPALATWIEPANWPGAMPPLTLISFLAGTLALGVWARHWLLGKDSSK